MPGDSYDRLLASPGIALPFLQSHPAFAQPKWVHYVGLGAVFVGAVLGMLVMGYMGALLGAYTRNSPPQHDSQGRG